MLTLFAHYICLHGYILIIYLFDPNKKILRYVPYTANQPKNTEILLFAHIATPYFEETYKKLFFLTEFMPFKSEYNSNCD